VGGVAVGGVAVGGVGVAGVGVAGVGVAGVGVTSGWQTLLPPDPEHRLEQQSPLI
jgi:hypothetical protein